MSWSIKIITRIKCITKQRDGEVKSYYRHNYGGFLCYFHKQPDAHVLPEVEESHQEALKAYDGTTTIVTKVVRKSNQ